MGINMGIQIIEQMEDTLKVLIQCKKADNKVLRLKTHIELFDDKLYTKKDNESCFMALITLYEGMEFYQIGLFQNTGNFMPWSIFIGIIFVLYVICIVIYQQYSKRQGKLYTQALETYQQERRKSNA